MKRACIISTLLFAGLSVASAQNDRSWVASNGSDSNGCGRSAPCRTFAHAIAVTNAGGEIDAVDSADYGPLVVDRSVVIDGGHNIAAINGYLASACDTIYDATAICVTGQHVTLRNLSINGTFTSSSFTGISYGIIGAGGILHVENVTVTATGHSGIVVAAGTADIKDSLIRDCLGEGVEAASGTLVTIDNAMIAGVQGFAAVFSAGTTTVRNSSLIHNHGSGVFAAGGTLTVDNALIANNFVGVLPTPSPASIQLSNTTITGNATGIATNGPVISFVNNRIYGNTVNGVPTLSVYQK